MSAYYCAACTLYIFDLTCGDRLGNIGHTVNIDVASGQAGRPAGSHGCRLRPPRDEGVCEGNLCDNFE